MSTAIARNFQIGIDPTATNNFTLYQPATPDGTLRLGNGNTGITSSLLTLTSTGSLNFGGTAVRITGDFSNATIANRVMFQTSTVNGNTQVRAIPNGTGAVASIQAGSNNDPNNQSIFALQIVGSEAQLASAINGSGTFLPMTFNTAGSERMRLDTSGNVGIGTSSPSSFGRLAVSGDLVTVPDTNSVIKSARFSAGFGGAAYSTIGGATFMSLQIEGTEHARITNAGLFQFNSGYGSVATAFGCRAWVNFNGTGTVAIRGSGNVSSITDNGTGDYTVNFTTAMPDANYAGVATTGRNGGGSGLVIDAANAAVPTTSAYRFYTLNTAFSPADSGFIFVSIFR